VSEKRGLSSAAYDVTPGEQYKPYVPETESPSEFTLKAVLLGVVVGTLFGAANTYIGLRVGLCISSSIPVAVISMGVFGLMRRGGVKSTILENNMSQTVGSAGEALAAGTIFTLPALFMWGFNPSVVHMTIIALAGGLLGVLFMIPLRRYLICREHGRLPYPEGTACAEVLVAGDAGGSQARGVFEGLVVGAVYKFLMTTLNLWDNVVGFTVPGIRKARLSLDADPALLGVGYVLGYRVAALMVGGSLLSWLVLIPLIAFFGEGFKTPLLPETTLPVAAMEPAQIWNRYIRYIGAGAVAFGGLVTLARAVPTIVRSFRIGFAEILGSVKAGTEARIRTQRDLPLGFVLAGAVVLGLTIALVPHIVGEFESYSVRIVAAALIVLFSFFFVTVSSRIVGLLGQSSSPISGMTIATLLGTSLIFALMGWTGDAGKITALSVGAVVCVAASVAGDTSQDLKTGFLVGATPRRQQVGELVGVVSAALFICLTIVALHRAYGLGSEQLAAPQATLMKLVVEGVLASSIPWGLVFIGVAIAAIVELLSIPSLPLAVGIYLPLSTMSPIFVGGCIRRLVELRSRGEDESRGGRRERGILFGSGLIGGVGLTGVLTAFWVYFAKVENPEAMGIGSEWLGSYGGAFTLLLFVMLCLALYATTRPKKVRA
jgi:putative OPT family oligopeptide transporter